MTKYQVTYEAPAFAFITVDVPDDEEGWPEDTAAEMAGKFLPPQLCFQCAGFDRAWKLEVADDASCWEEIGVEKVDD